ncbi:acid-sensing ion channel 1-like isoform X2 [Ruditapes philippinarum]|uniref:acid-sensing ion channel 1-like isoform X2 n=1 Tax=Ruditapes philippinarum TaxID=129788 RepID=UPI00295A9870|nr:acid-sensing ion channel 1-like isoform X2 [Ruditapes philippinarum]
MKGNRVIANNFLKLNIYYEDLNFENLTEVPEIEIQQFLSDVGGAIGLWIGLSILSLCELVQLFVELCDYGMNKTIKETRKGRRQRRKARRNLAVTSAKSTSIAQDEDKLPRKYFSNDYDNKRFETEFPEGLQNGNAREYSYRK